MKKEPLSYLDESLTGRSLALTSLKHISHVDLLNLGCGNTSHVRYILDDQRSEIGRSHVLESTTDGHQRRTARAHNHRITSAQLWRATGGACRTGPNGCLEGAMREQVNDGEKKKKRTEETPHRA
jgi:hypothetical protein